MPNTSLSFHLRMTSPAQTFKGTWQAPLSAKLRGRALSGIRSGPSRGPVGILSWSPRWISTKVYLACVADICKHWQGSGLQRTCHLDYCVLMHAGIRIGLPECMYSVHTYSMGRVPAGQCLPRNGFVPSLLYEVRCHLKETPDASHRLWPLLIIESESISSTCPGWL